MRYLKCWYMLIDCASHSVLCDSVLNKTGVCHELKAFKNYSFGEPRPIDEYTGRSKLACSIDCLREEWCTFFGFQSGTRLCQLFNKTITSTPTRKNTGSSYYKCTSTEFCPSSSGYTYNTKSDTCYKIIPQIFLTVDGARKMCLSCSGGSVITVDTPQRQVLVEKVLSSYDVSVVSGTFTSAILASNPARWKWGTGEEIVYSKWDLDNNEPLNSGTSVVILKDYQYYWRDYSSINTNVICELRRPV